MDCVHVLVHSHSHNIHTLKLWNVILILIWKCVVLCWKLVDKHCSDAKMLFDVDIGKQVAISVSSAKRGDDVVY